MRALAELANTSHSAIAAYESGRKSPTLETLTRVIEAAGFELDVSLRPLRNRTGENGPMRMTRGEEFEAVLELAAEFPTRHSPTLDAPVFGR